MAKKKKKPVGSYTDFFRSKKKYHGKGPEFRAKQSGKKIAESENDDFIDSDWEESENDREAFKDEHKRIMTDEGENLSEDNYNKIASPGKRYMIEDDELDED